jgi:hypothetical protein
MNRFAFGKLMQPHADLTQRPFLISPSFGSLFTIR